MRVENIEPVPTLEEAAAILVALRALEGESRQKPAPGRGRWRLAGILGHPPPRRAEPERSLWSQSRWEGMV